MVGEREGKIAYNQAPSLGHYKNKQQVWMLMRD